jgi:hypothetical protein
VQSKSFDRGSCVVEGFDKEVQKSGESIVAVLLTATVF